MADVVNRIASLPERTRILVTAPLKLAEGQGLIEKLTLLVGEGMQRIHTRGETLFIEEMIPRADDYAGRDDLAIVVDRARTTSDEETLSRLGDSVENAFRHGDGICEIVVLQEGADRVERFSSRFELDGIAFEQPTEHMFSFNNPVGACPRCEGYGKVIGIDEDLVVPDKTKSIYQDAIACWRGETMKWWKEQLILERPEIRLPRPPAVLRAHAPAAASAVERERAFSRDWTSSSNTSKANATRYSTAYCSRSYTGQDRSAPTAAGARLRKEALYVQGRGQEHRRAGGHAASDELAWPFSADLVSSTNATRETAPARADRNPQPAAAYLTEVGSGYLTLDRLSSTLSGGESQRINLATSLGQQPGRIALHSRRAEHRSPSARHGAADQAC